VTQMDSFGLEWMSDSPLSLSLSLSLGFKKRCRETAMAHVLLLFWRERESERGV
jgi:hypothetical protein